MSAPRTPAGWTMRERIADHLDDLRAAAYRHAALVVRLMADAMLDPAYASHLRWRSITLGIDAFQCSIRQMARTGEVTARAFSALCGQLRAIGGQWDPQDDPPTQPMD